MGGLFVLAASAAGSLPLGVTESGNWFLRKQLLGWPEA